MRVVGSPRASALIVLTLMMLSLAACGDRAKPSGAVFGQCITANQVEASEGIRFLRLIPNDAGGNRPTCRGIFETLSAQVPDDQGQEILVLSYFVDISDIERAIENCGLSERKDLPFFRWRMSQMLRECRDSYAFDALTSLTSAKIEIGDFIPSDYRNNDISVMYWDRDDDAPYGAMLAGIFESETYGVVPVCLHFRQRLKTQLPEGKYETDEPEFLDEIETCLSRFVHLN